MLLHAETKEIQETLASYCRNGRVPSINISRPDALKHYRRLIRNVITNTMEAAFPITYQWLDLNEWDQLIDEFMDEHDSQTPSVWKLPKEFAQYVISRNYQQLFDKPALNDLIRFEWCEVEIHTLEDVAEPDVVSLEFTADKKLQLNPYHQTLELQFPIHRLVANEAQLQKGNYFVFVYRELDTGKVRFLDISPLHVFLLKKINQHNISLADVLPDLCNVFKLRDVDVVNKHLSVFCRDMVDKKILIIT